MVKRDRERLLSTVIELAGHADTERTASAVLARLLADTEDLDFAAEVYARLPPRPSAGLAPLAAQVTARLVAGLMKQGPPDALVAGMLNNLSEWSDLAGAHEAALHAAAAGTGILRGLVRHDPAAREAHVILLIALAKRLDTAGRRKEAVAVAQEAVRQAARLPPDQGHRRPQRLAQARLVLAHRLVHGTSARAALRPARGAVQGLVRLARRHPDLRHDLALARLTCSNLLSELGRHRESLVHARASHRLYWRLVAEDPGQHLEYHLAAASAYAAGLGALGRHRRSAAVTGRCVEYLLQLERRFPGLYRRDLVAVLTTYSNALAAVGRRREAGQSARLAKAKARRVMTAGGVRDYRLEAQAATVLYHRAMEAGRPTAAVHAARSAVEGLAKAGDSRPEVRLEFALAWRNLAEALRLRARPPRRLRPALAATERAWLELQALPPPWTIATKEAAALCRLSLSLCLHEAGDPAAAATAAKEAVALRRSLPAADARAAGLAYALQQAARCWLAADTAGPALAAAKESAALYGRLRRFEGIRHAPALVESLHLAAAAALRLGRHRPATQFSAGALLRMTRAADGFAGDDWERRRHELRAIRRAAAQGQAAVPKVPASSRG